MPYKKIKDRIKFQKNYKASQRVKVIKYYSKGKMNCKCCGEKEYKFLAIDHSNNNGYEHRKTLNTPNIALWIIKNGYPKGFQILCHNCNMGKRMNGGICPHKMG